MYATIKAGKKRNKLKMKNSSQLCPLRRATRAGQNASATKMIKQKIPNKDQCNPDIANL
jgi:hypothetical protein